MYQRRWAAVITLSLENNFLYYYWFKHAARIRIYIYTSVKACVDRSRLCCCFFFFFSSLGFCRAVTFTDTSERRNCNNCTRTEKLNDLTREKEKDQNPIQLISIHASWFLSYYQNSSYVIFTILLEILDFYVFINFILFFKLWWPTK